MTTGGAICAAASHDTCAEGVTGTGPGEFSALASVGSYLSVGPGDVVFVGDQERVEEFDQNGAYQTSVPVLGEMVRSLSVDHSGDLYIASASEERPVPAEEDVQKIGPVGNVLCTARVADPTALATDALGNLYVANAEPEQRQTIYPEVELLRFSPNCQRDTSYSLVTGKSANTSLYHASTGIAIDTVTSDGRADLYYTNLAQDDSFVRAYGPPPDLWPPPVVAPSIDDQFASSVGRESATLEARIDPHFWPTPTSSSNTGPHPARRAAAPRCRPRRATS